MAAEAVEVVDEAAAEKTLQGLVDVVDVDPLLEHFVAVDVDENLRHGWAEGRRHAGQFWPFARRLDEFVGVGREEVDVLAGAILKNEGRPARGADARNRWRRESETDGAAQATELSRQARLDRLVLFFRSLAVLPVLEGDEKEGAVSVLHLAQHAVADDGGHVLDPRRGLDHFLGLAGDFTRALQRGGVRQLDAGEDVALILFGQKAGRHMLAEEARGNGDPDQEEQAEQRLVDGEATDADVAC